MTNFITPLLADRKVYQAPEYYPFADLVEDQFTNTVFGALGHYVARKKAATGVSIDPDVPGAYLEALGDLTDEEVFMMLDNRYRDKGEAMAALYQMREAGKRYARIERAGAVAQLVSGTMAYAPQAVLEYGLFRGTLSGMRFMRMPTGLKAQAGADIFAAGAGEFGAESLRVALDPVDGIEEAILNGTTGTLMAAGMIGAIEGVRTRPWTRTSESARRAQNPERAAVGHAVVDQPYRPFKPPAMDPKIYDTEIAPAYGLSTGRDSFGEFLAGRADDGLRGQKFVNPRQETRASGEQIIIADREQAETLGFKLKSGMDKVVLVRSGHRDKWAQSAQAENLAKAEDLVIGAFPMRREVDNFASPIAHGWMQVRRADVLGEYKDVSMGPTRRAILVQKAAADEVEALRKIYEDHKTEMAAVKDARKKADKRRYYELKRELPAVRDRYETAVRDNELYLKSGDPRRAVFEGPLADPLVRTLAKTKQLWYWTGMGNRRVMESPVGALWQQTWEKLAGTNGAMLPDPERPAVRSIMGMLKSHWFGRFEGVDQILRDAYTEKHNMGLGHTPSSLIRHGAKQAWQRRWSKLKGIQPDPNVQTYADFEKSVHEAIIEKVDNNKDNPDPHIKKAVDGAVYYIKDIEAELKPAGILASAQNMQTYIDELAEQVETQKGMLDADAEIQTNLPEGSDGILSRYTELAEKTERTAVEDAELAHLRHALDDGKFRKAQSLYEELAYNDHSEYALGQMSADLAKILANSTPGELLTWYRAKLDKLVAAQDAPEHLRNMFTDEVRWLERVMQLRAIRPHRVDTGLDKDALAQLTELDQKAVRQAQEAPKASRVDEAYAELMDTLAEREKIAPYKLNSMDLEFTFDALPTRSDILHTRTVADGLTALNAQKLAAERKLGWLKKPRFGWHMPRRWVSELIDERLELFKAGLKEYYKKNSDELEGLSIDERVEATIRTMHGENTYNDIAGVVEFTDQGVPLRPGALARRRLGMKSSFTASVIVDGKKQDFIAAEFLDPNVSDVLQNYTNRIAGALEMQRAFGSMSGEEYIQELARKSAAAGVDQADIDEMVGAFRDGRDAVLGLDAIGGSDPTHWMNRGLRLARYINILAFMGRVPEMMVIDTGMLTHVAGFKHLLSAMNLTWQGEATDLGRAMKKESVGILGAGAEVTQMSMAGMFANEFVGRYDKMSAPERWFQNAAHRYFFWTGASWFTDIQRRWAGTLIGHEIIRLSGKVADGTISNQDMAKLRQLGLDREKARGVYGEWLKIPENQRTYRSSLYGAQLNLMQSPRWGDVDLAAHVGQAVRNEMDNNVFSVNAATRPKILREEWARALLLYSTFGIHSTQTLQMRVLQRGPRQMMGALTSMVALGFLITSIRAPDYVERDPEDAIWDAISASGVLGFQETIFQKFADMTGTNGGLGYVGIDPKPWNEGVDLSAINPISSQWYALFQSLFDPELAGEDRARAWKYMWPYNQHLIWAHTYDAPNRIKDIVGEALP